MNTNTKHKQKYFILRKLKFKAKAIQWAISYFHNHNTWRKIKIAVDAFYIKYPSIKSLLEIEAYIRKYFL